MFTVILAIYISITVPFFIAFYPDFPGIFLLVNLGINFIYILDLCLNFATSYIDNDSEVVQLNKIAKHYLMTMMTYDIISSIPFDAFVASSGLQNSKYFGLALLVNMLKLSKLSRISAIIKN